MENVTKTENKINISEAFKRMLINDKGLNDRQASIVFLITQGLSNEEIAFSMETTDRAVKCQLTKIYSKIGVKSRAQLIVWSLPHLSNSAIEHASNNLDRVLEIMDERMTLRQLENSLTPASMYVMGMLSDVQEMISRGLLEMAVRTLDNAKFIIDERLSTKDEHGRHDFNRKEKHIGNRY